MRSGSSAADSSADVQLAREIVEAHVPPAMARVVLEQLDRAEAAPLVSDTPDPLLTVQEVAAMFSSPGRQVHASTVYRMIDRGDLREQRIGRMRRVRRSEVDRYLRDNERLAERRERVRTSRRSPDEARVYADNAWLEAI